MPRGEERQPVWARTERGSRPSRQRRRPSREQIVAAALAVADEEGFEAVSMRNVARRLRVGAMTLYTYVESKDDLLDLMFDEVMRELLLPELPDEWRAAIGAIAHRTRDVWLRHAWLASSIGERSGLGPNSMRHVEQSLAALDGLGLEGPEAFVVLGAVDDYVLGHVMRQAGMQAGLRREGIDRDEWRARMEPYWREMIATGEFPRLARIAEAEWDSLNEERFELGLQWLLDGIAARYER
jgi:AcrR family transcriptional regulator